jgi:hypothetical protein
MARGHEDDRHLGRKKKTTGALRKAAKVLMTDELLADLEGEAARRGLSLSAYIRQEMTLTVERHKAERANRSLRSPERGE